MSGSSYKQQRPRRRRRVPSQLAIVAKPVVAAAMVCVASVTLMGKADACRQLRCGLRRSTGSCTGIKQGGSSAAWPQAVQAQKAPHLKLASALRRFRLLSDATKAMQSLDNMDIVGQQIRVALAAIEANPQVPAGMAAAVQEQLDVDAGGHGGQQLLVAQSLQGIGCAAKHKSCFCSSFVPATWQGRLRTAG